jgi:hypothetical protein
LTLTSLGVFRGKILGLALILYLPEDQLVYLWVVCFSGQMLKDPGKRSAVISMIMNNDFQVSSGYWSQAHLIHNSDSDKNLAMPAI